MHEVYNNLYYHNRSIRSKVQKGCHRAGITCSDVTGAETKMEVYIWKIRIREYVHSIKMKGMLKNKD